MVEFKLIALDLDDTLLRDDSTISADTLDTLLRVQERGVRIVLASGRPYYGMEGIAKYLRIDRYGGFVLALNGALVKDFSRGKWISRSVMPLSHVQEIYNFSLENDLFYQIYSGDTIITPKLNKYTELEAHKIGMKTFEAKDINLIVNNTIPKVVLLQEPGYLKSMVQPAKDRFKDKLSVTVSGPVYLEFMDYGVDKGVALESICSYAGIELKNVMAVGNSFNDIGMIMRAGLGVAVANAEPEVLEVADYITSGNEDDGVAKVIKKFCFDL